MEPFADLVQKKGVASALREEAGAALSHPSEFLNSIKKPVAEATVAVAGAYLAHRLGPAAVEKGAELLSPLAKEVGASFKMDALSGFGPQLALADGASFGEKTTFAAKMLAKTTKTAEAEAFDKPMLMSTTGSAGGGPRDFNYRKGVNQSGETIHSFDNVQTPNVVNHFAHADNTKVFFGHEGGLYVQFPGTSTYRTLEFGRNIESVQIKEAANGIKEYRFNGENRTAMLVNTSSHDVIGYPANGDRIFIADNRPSGLIFNHSNGGSTHIGTGGQIDITLPSGKVQTTSVGRPFKQAYITEHNSGAISLRFTDQNERMMTGEVRVEPSAMAPRSPAPRTYINTPPAASSWRSPLERQSPVQSPSDGIDFFRYDANGGHGHHDAFNPFNIPTSPERAIDQRLTGVPGGMVSGSRLDSPADMFTAQMAGNNRWLGRWLNNLGKPEKF